MDTVQKVVLIGHTLIAVLIIVLVLMQRGKGADAGAAFGSGASGTVFGSRGSSSFFSRATAILATAFFVSSLTLAYMSSQRTAGPGSLLDDAPAAESAPAALPTGNEELPATDLPSSGDQPQPATELPPVAEELPTTDLPVIDDRPEAGEASSTPDDELPSVPEQD